MKIPVPVGMTNRGRYWAIVPGLARELRVEADTIEGLSEEVREALAARFAMLGELVRTQKEWRVLEIEV